MTEPSRRKDELILDELTEQFDRTRRLLMGNPEEAAEQALARLGGQAEVEARIAVQIADRPAVAHPERFPEAHRVVLRALEVLDREGSQNPRVRGFGPLNGLLEPAVEFIAEYVVQSYAESIAGRMRSLYVRREAQAEPGTPDRHLLARARMEMERIAPGFRGGGVAAPLLLVGGFALPAVAGMGNVLGGIDFGSTPVVLAMLGVLFVAFYALSSILLQGAAVAGRRSRLIMQKPLEALWETVGQAGNPPRDDSTLIGVVAIVMTTIAWLIVPASVVIAFAL